MEWSWSVTWDKKAVQSALRSEIRPLVAIAKDLGINPNSLWRQMLFHIYIEAFPLIAGSEYHKGGMFNQCLTFHIINPNDPRDMLVIRGLAKDALIEELKSHFPGWEPVWKVEPQ